jgi:16S rRNA (cytosine967-C5)-methyltransferase
MKQGRGETPGTGNASSSRGAQRPGGGQGREAHRGSAPRGTSVPVPAKITPARRAAFEVLSLVGAGKGHSDDLLHTRRVDALSPEDRNLATALVMGVLRWQIALDAQIAPLLSRPGQKIPEPVAIALRMGAFQLLHMDRIPAHAALSESVELCRAGGEPQAAGMVNAVLRRISTAGSAKVPIFETPARFAERLSHPRWLVERWAAEYGRDAALAICEYDQKEPGAGGLFSHESATGEPAERHGREELPQIDDGSRLVAELAAAAVAGRDPAGLRVWDCCAAPGGKTLVLAARLPQVKILATDVSARRLEQTVRRMAGFEYARNVSTAVADATTPGEAEGEFDLILCDVPCSGTGTLARNPEIRLQLGAAELESQAQRQRAILGNALRRLAPGGRLVYSTCSLEPEENERVVEAVVRTGTLNPVPVPGLLGLLRDSGVLPGSSAELLLRSGVRGYALRTLPGVQPCDGFFAVVLERV